VKNRWRLIEPRNRRHSYPDEAEIRTTHPRAEKPRSALRGEEPDESQRRQHGSPHGEKFCVAQQIHSGGEKTERENKQRRRSNGAASREKYLRPKTVGAVSFPERERERGLEVPPVAGYRSPKRKSRWYEKPARAERRRVTQDSNHPAGASEQKMGERRKAAKTSVAARIKRQNQWNPSAAPEKEELARWRRDLDESRDCEP
jgi:hypothetical protein